LWAVSRFCNSDFHIKMYLWAVSRFCNSDFHIKIYLWAGIIKDKQKSAAGLFQTVLVLKLLRAHQRWENRACRCFTTGNNTGLLCIFIRGKHGAYNREMIWYDMIWYDIFNYNWVATRWQKYSIHLHTNNIQNDTKQTIHKTTQKLGRVRTVPRLCGFYTGICLTTEEKARKNLSQGSHERKWGTILRNVVITADYGVCIKRTFTTFLLSILTHIWVMV
jgi:hypothetical protein